MTNQQILEKAIQKAVDNGYVSNYIKPRVEELIDSSLHYAVIFNHDFAKALWPDSYHKGSVVYGLPPLENDVIAWQYHLQHMVIADDPIKYLGKNL